jgi:glycosyltransferase involved in cell wall biosynthesis
MNPPVKILHVETGRHFLGGPQQVVYLLQALQERGHHNTLVCPRDSAIDASARQAGIHVHNLSCAGDLDLVFAGRLARLLHQTAPEIVHCHGRRGADVLGGLAASVAGIPAVVSRRVDNPEARLMAALRYRPFRKVIAVSEAVAAVLRAQGVDERRLVVIRDAVDVAAFEAVPECSAIRREFSLVRGDFVVAAAGQLIPRKGHRYLLQAIASLREHYPKLKLIVFGEGQLEHALRAQATALGLDGVVHFAGFRADLDAYLGCFDLFAHPSLAEGLGVAALKASAAGLPVVGFDAGGTAEAVEHGSTGLLAPAGDHQALAEAIRCCIDEPTFASQLGAAGRARMRAAFSVAAMAEQHEALYRAVVAA